jgi:transcriptional regulator with XRE-family HTH domain
MQTTWPEDIGRVARQRRVDLNISQDDLAERTGVTRQWLSRFESAKADVSLSKVLLILRALDLRVDIAATPPKLSEAELAVRASDVMAPTVASINIDLLVEMTYNLPRAMGRSGVSESAQIALDSLHENLAYQRALDRLQTPMASPRSEIPSAQDRRVSKAPQ